MNDILSNIIKIILEKFDIKKCTINYETRFTQDLGLDSLDIIEFIMELEKTFNIEIFDEESNKIHNIKDCISLIEKKLYYKKNEE